MTHDIIHYIAVYLRSEEEVHIAELELYKGQYTAITLLYMCTIIYINAYTCVFTIPYCHNNI